MRFPPLESLLKFYAVIPTVKWVERMVRTGADAVQLRCETLHGNELKQEIERCVAACHGNRSQLFINDHWREAMTADACSVHLGQGDMDTTDFAAIATMGLQLGLSAHSLEEIDGALALHPSYAASDAVFPTAIKDMPTTPQGLEWLHGQVMRADDTPVVAIGGITLDNAADVLATGVVSLAVVSAVAKAGDPEAAVKSFQALWK